MAENTQEALRKFVNEYFLNNITDPEIQKDPRNWHKCLQIFSKYKENSMILNTTTGPIANLNQWK